VPSGQVLSASNTNTANTITNTNTGGEPDYQAMWTALGREGSPPVGWHGESGGDGQSEAERIAAEQRAAIEAGYSSYAAQLDAMLNESLPGQQQALEAQAQAQLNKGLAEALLQKTEGEKKLQSQRERTEKSQKKSLKSIADDIRNAMMAGQVFLGARGAGDSSAANMYSYALTKLASKQRGDIMTQTADIMAQINERASSLQNIYNTEKTKIQEDYNNRVGQILQWFYEQQNQLRTTKGQLGVMKGKDLATLSQTLLDQALAEMGAIKQQALQKQSMLEQWAMNNATNIQQLRSNLQSVANINPALPQAQPIAGQPQMSGGSLRVRPIYGGGYPTNEREKLFGGGASGGYGASGGF